MHKLQIREKVFCAVLIVLGTIGVYSVLVPEAKAAPPSTCFEDTTPPDVYMHSPTIEPSSAMHLFVCGKVKVIRGHKKTLIYQCYLMRNDCADAR